MVPDLVHAGEDGTIWISPLSHVDFSAGTDEGLGKFIPDRRSEAKQLIEAGGVNLYGNDPLLSR